MKSARKRIKQQPRCEVGYKRPPKEGQFKAGTSGNPKGRPKGSRSIGVILNQVLGQRIAVTENGKTRRLPALEVMLKRVTNAALRNEPAALKMLLALFDRYGQSGESTVHLEDILEEDKAILANFLKTPAAPAHRSEQSSKKRSL